MSKGGSMGEERLEFRVATIDEIYLLRFAVLRPGWVPERIHFSGDELSPPATWHFGAFEKTSEGAIRNVGCLTLLTNSFERRKAVQLRGMAVAPEARSCGIGSRLLRKAEEVVRGETALRELPWWCNARVDAVRFYERNGWRVVSEVFEISGAGPHRKMVKEMRPG